MKNIFFTLSAAALCALSCFGTEYTTDSAWEALRQAAINRPRRVIYNTDGCDAIYFPEKLPATKENFINERLRFSRGSKIDTVDYNVMQGFNLVLYNTKVAEVMNQNPPPGKANSDTDANPRAVTEELIANGTDPLQIAIEFCREENKEIFASLRFNDLHDQVAPLDQPYFLRPQFKVDHPDWLLGAFDKRPPFCVWCGVDYTQAGVREQMKAIVNELCNNYDIDGIEYDLMRHVNFFKSVANGNSASPEELDLLTGLMRDLREIAEEAGKKRGRPILVIIRVPDSIEYCRGVGIDLERWLSEKLVDLVVGTSYFQLTPWADFAAIIHQYGAKYYAALDESRIEKPNLESIKGRSIVNPSFMFAREAAAFAAGCDGIYYFNLEYGRLSAIARLGLDELPFVNKDYYATERGSGSYRARQFLNGGGKFNRMPRLDPGEPIRISAGKPYPFTMMIADDFTKPEVKARLKQITALLLTDAPAEANLRLTVNGTSFLPKRMDSRLLAYELPPEVLIAGTNQFELLADQSLHPLDFCLKINYLPEEYPELSQYKSVPLNISARVAVQEDKAVLSAHIRSRYQSDLMPVEGSHLHLIHNSGNPSAKYQNFSADNAVKSPVPVFLAEWRMRVASSTQGQESFLVLPTLPKMNGEGFWLETIGISNYELSTRGSGKVLGGFSEFRTFRLAMDCATGKYVLWIDGEAALTGKAVTAWGPLVKAGSFLFGDCSGAVGGEVELEYFHIGTPEQ